MAEKVLHKSKKWLDTDATDFIYTEITSDTWRMHDNKTGQITNRKCHYGTLRLADNHEIVNFSIDADNDKECLRTIKKLDIMIDEINALRNAIVDIYNG